LTTPSAREIPFNYTSADDNQVISFLLGRETVGVLDELRSARVTGRSARRLMRIFGDVLIHRRNPYLFQELIDSAPRRQRFFANIAKDMDAIHAGRNGDERVLDMLARCGALIAELRSDVDGAPDLRSRMKRDLGAVVGATNVNFDPFSLVSHATDATDWRLHLPVAVVTPEREADVAPLLTAIARLGLKAIPRGAGTGLTGGSVPLRSGCVVVNTERLTQIRGIDQRELTLEDGRVVTADVMEVESGVVTEKAMEHAHEHGLVFATDPTSAWASTIGGNIAENAGGKLAVRWGTCIDNLLEWRISIPNGQRWTVRRTNHQFRKILPQDLVTFEVVDEQGAQVKQIDLKGTEIRKRGLWKDITNKTLGGLPGMQKEGTDGIITSAVFVLYPAYQAKKTMCLEFFGPDFEEASHVILELARAFPFPRDNEETLLALEHFDDEYIRAIGYKVKAARAQTPKAVLLIDVAGDSLEQADRGVERARQLLQQHPNTMLFVARDSAEATRFWADRKKLGAGAEIPGPAVIEEAESTLLVPPAEPATLGTCIAVAWKQSDAAIRAIEAALPLLLRAEQVCVLMETDHASDTAPLELIDRLAQAGVPVHVLRFEAGERSTGEALIAEAHEAGADLLVMGAYTHNRLTEFILGGATREVIAAADLPVLLHH